jgi:adenylate cyclase class 2
MDANGFEREVKLPFPTLDAARAAVQSIGAAPLRGRRLQDDALLDRADEMLRSRRCVLRVRMECGKSRVTWKGPVQPSVVKVREELETVVGHGEILLRVFAELGFEPWFRYQKYREEFAQEDVVIAIDETPIGIFVELEGSEAGIAAVARQLGRRPEDYVVDSYRTLFVNWQHAHGAHGRAAVAGATRCAHRRLHTQPHRRSASGGSTRGHTRRPFGQRQVGLAHRAHGRRRGARERSGRRQQVLDRAAESLRNGELACLAYVVGFLRPCQACSTSATVITA